MCVIKVSGSVDRVYVSLHDESNEEPPPALPLLIPFLQPPPTPASLKPMSLCRLIVTEVVSLCEV